MNARSTWRALPRFKAPIIPTLTIAGAVGGFSDFVGVTRPTQSVLALYARQATLDPCAAFASLSAWSTVSASC